MQPTRFVNIYGVWVEPLKSNDIVKKTAQAAEQSRHQFAFRVTNLSALLELVETTSGSLEMPITGSMTAALLRDPDGNTLEVTQA